MSKILITNNVKGREEFWFCTACVFYKFPHICPFFAQYDWILWINNWPSDLRKTEKKFLSEILMKRERKGKSVVKLNFVSQSFSVVKIIMVLICFFFNPYSCVFQKYFLCRLRQKRRGCEWGSVWNVSESRPGRWIWAKERRRSQKNAKLEFKNPRMKRSSYHQSMRLTMSLSSPTRTKLRWLCSEPTVEWGVP